MQGGAMYALERGLHMRWLGLIFAVFDLPGLLRSVSDVPHRLTPSLLSAMRIYTSIKQLSESSLAF